MYTKSTMYVKMDFVWTVDFNLNVNAKFNI